MWPFKKKDKRYMEISWDYPVPEGATLQYKYKFTNHPQSPDRSMGNGGRGYECFDLHDAKQVNLTSRLNYGYKANNRGVPYIPHDVLDKCRVIYANTKGGVV